MAAGIHLLWRDGASTMSGPPTFLDRYGTIVEEVSETILVPEQKSMPAPRTGKRP